MGKAITDLLPLLAGATLVPIYPIIALLLLQSEGGLLKAGALLAGNVILRLAQWFLFDALFETATDTYSEEGSSLIATTLLLILGILLLIKAYKTWNKEADLEEELPKWMSSLGGLSTLKAAGVGALYVLISPKQWVFTLAAISTIGEAKLDGAANFGLYLLYTIAAQIFVLTPIVALVIAPQRAFKPVKGAYDWLVKYNQTIIMVFSLIFGVWFLIKGIVSFLT